MAKKRFRIVIEIDTVVSQRTINAWAKRQLARWEVGQGSEIVYIATDEVTPGARMVLHRTEGHAGGEPADE